MPFTFTMHRHRTGSVFGDFEEFFQNQVTGGAAVVEVQIVMLETTVDEAIRIVGFFIQTDDIRNAVGFEVREVVFGSMFLRIGWKMYKYNENSRDALYIPKLKRYLCRHENEVR